MKNFEQKIKQDENELLENKIVKKKFFKGYSKIHELKLVTIGLASPEKIQMWAEKQLPNGKIFGEVLNANTFHYRTFQPTKGGLFCERIFGPLKDFECACGKRQKPNAFESRKILEHRQTTRYFCSNCDVEYTWSLIRRYQLGYIKLNAPVTHIWYLKTNPSYFSLFFDIKRKSLESIIYCTESFTIENMWKSSEQKSHFNRSPTDLYEMWQKFLSFEGKRDKYHFVSAKKKQEKITTRQNFLFFLEKKSSLNGKIQNQSIFFTEWPREKKEDLNQKEIQNVNENAKWIAKNRFQINIFQKLEKKKQKKFLFFVFRTFWKQTLQKNYENIFFVHEIQKFIEKDFFSHNFDQCFWYFEKTFNFIFDFFVKFLFPNKKATEIFQNFLFFENELLLKKKKTFFPVLNKKLKIEKHEKKNFLFFQSLFFHDEENTSDSKFLSKFLKIKHFWLFFLFLLKFSEFCICSTKFTSKTDKKKKNWRRKNQKLFSKKKLLFFFFLIPFFKKFEKLTFLKQKQQFLAAPEFSQNFKFSPKFTKKNFQTFKKTKKKLFSKKWSFFFENNEFQKSLKTFLFISKSQLNKEKKQNFFMPVLNIYKINKDVSGIPCLRWERKKTENWKEAVSFRIHPLSPSTSFTEQLEKGVFFGKGEGFENEVHNEKNTNENLKKLNLFLSAAPLLAKNFFMAEGCTKQKSLKKRNFLEKFRKNQKFQISSNLEKLISLFFSYYEIDFSFYLQNQQQEKSLLSYANEKSKINFSSKFLDFQNFQKESKIVNFCEKAIFQYFSFLFFLFKTEFLPTFNFEFLSFQKKTENFLFVFKKQKKNFFIPYLYPFSRSWIYLFQYSSSFFFQSFSCTPSEEMEKRNFFLQKNQKFSIVFEANKQLKKEKKTEIFILNTSIGLKKKRIQKKKQFLIEQIEKNTQRIPHTSKFLTNPVSTISYCFVWKNDSDWKYFVYYNSFFLTEFQDSPIFSYFCRKSLQSSSFNIFPQKFDTEHKNFSSSSFELWRKNIFSKSSFDFNPFPTPFQNLVQTQKFENTNSGKFFPSSFSQSFVTSNFHAPQTNSQYTFQSFSFFNVSVGAGILEKLLTEYTSNELKKIIKQHKILLPKLNQIIRILKHLSRTKKESLKIQKYFQKREHIIRRLKFLRKFFRKNSNPTFMILRNLPVLPPDLRPILKLQNQIAASDLNRFYQRIIYRNERLKKFAKDSATNQSFELKYAQRLLQEAVDNLIQNGKGGVKPETNSRGQPLKSLSEILKGKQGRFRQYLLGKRVDYSGRSVIVVGPKLKLYECGLPKEMAFELFLPFLIQQILQLKLTKTVIGAKNLLKNDSTLAFHLLKKILKNSPILLNRAPTLHRLGFQAFLPKLIEGRAILLHPMVCPGFNADFDGDQMAVHIPLTVEARTEAWKFMLATNNFMNSATGEPILLPTQDMVLGCYYLTTDFHSKKAGFQIKNALKAEPFQKFSDFQISKKSFLFFHNLPQVFGAYQRNEISLHTPVWVRWNGQVDFANEFTKSIELRLQRNGYFEKIQLKSTFFYNEKNENFSKFIRTTAGRIYMNFLLQEFLRAGRSPAQK